MIGRCATSMQARVWVVRERLRAAETSDLSPQIEDSERFDIFRHLVGQRQLRWLRSGKVEAALTVEAGEFEQILQGLHPRLLSFAAVRADLDVARDATHQALAAVWERYKARPRPRTPIQRSRLEQLTFKVAYDIATDAQQSGRDHRGTTGFSQEAIANDEMDVAEESDLVPRPRSGRDDGLPPALCRLASSEREVLSYFVEGYKVREIAAILGRRPGGESASCSGEEELAFVTSGGAPR